jgi:alpha-tubulin suppressor-like RCC1 family protein
MSRARAVVIAGGVLLWAAAACVGQDPTLTHLPDGGGPAAEAAAPPDGHQNENETETETEAGPDAAIVVEPTAIDTKFDLSCVVLSTGGVRCWGPNDHFQAGTTTAGDVARTPVEVAGIEGAIAVSAGRDHACALTTDGTLRCWGANDVGQLGRDLAETGTKTATPFQPALPPGDPVTRISAGSQYSCAVTRGAKIYCWGANTAGSIWAADASAPVPPTPVPPTLLVVPDVSPQPLFADVRAESTHSCAVDSAGKFTCWGDNTFFQLGREATGNNFNNPPVPVEGLKAPAQVTAGLIHTCLTDAVNGPRCLGSNFAGQLGTATPLRSSIFQLRAVPGLDLASGAEELSAGASHTCARIGDGSVACVGLDDDGQLGDPSLDGGPQTTAIHVAGLSDVLSLASGARHTCALRARATAGADGRQSVVCWGGNALGQLGNGSDAGASSPTPVVGLD